MRRQKANMTNQKGSAMVILLIVLVVALAAVLVYFVFLKKPGEVAVSPTPTATATPTPTSKIITLTSPKNGAIYSGEIRITGKAKPGYYIQVYANYSAKDLGCLTFNSMSNGGADQADANGNFDFPINYQGYKSGQNTLVVAALQNSRVETCFPANNVSDVITYIYTGSVPNY